MAHKCDGCRYKGEHQEMMFRPFGVCTKGTNLTEAEKAYNADKCPYKKTNADRIRAMSDEELINIVPCPLGFSMFRCTKNQKCKDCKKEWLKQPAEVSKDGK